LQNTAFSAVQPPEGTNFPPKGVHEPLQATEIETGQVDKCAAQRGQEEPGVQQATRGCRPTRSRPCKRRKRRRAAAPPSALQPKTAPAGPDGPKTVVAKRQRDMVLEFWWAAQRELSAPLNQLFTEEQGRLACNAIYFGVYGGFPADWPLRY
jgi:hypothetical protein